MKKGCQCSLDEDEDVAKDTKSAVLKVVTDYNHFILFSAVHLAKLKIL